MGRFGRIFQALSSSNRDDAETLESQPLLGSAKRNYDEEQRIESSEAAALAHTGQLVISQNNGTVEVAQKICPIPSDTTTALSLPSGTFTIFITRLDGSCVLIPVLKSDSLDDVKEAIWEKLGVEPRNQRLIFRGRQLVENVMLGDYGIEKGSTLHLVLRLYGGGDTELRDLDVIHGPEQPQPTETLKRNELQLLLSWVKNQKADDSIVRRVFGQFRMVLFSSWQHIFLLAIPVGFIVRYLGYQPPAVFAVNFLAVFPSAFNIEEAIFSLTMHTNDTIGGLINMSIGNLVQLAASVILLRADQVSVLKTALIGTILSNVLLMSGLSFLVGGIIRIEQFFDPKRAQVWSTILILIVISLLIPTVSNLLSISDSQDVLVQSRGYAILLLISYGLYGLYTVGTHRDINFNTDDENSNSSTTEEGDDVSYLALPAAILTLIVFGTLLGFNMQLAADNLQSLLETTTLTPTFVGLIIMPLISATHLPLVLAWKNRLDLSLHLTVTNSIQTALVVVPLIVLISWGMGSEEMTLLFSGFEVMSMFAAVLVVSQVVSTGRSDWLQGALMVQAYLMIAVASFFMS